MKEKVRVHNLISQKESDEVKEWGVHEGRIIMNYCGWPSVRIHTDIMLRRVLSSN